MSAGAGPQQSLSARTLSGLGWSYLAAFIKVLLSLLVLVLLARLLTPVEFGLFGIAWIFITMGSRLGQSFVGPAIIQRSELSSGHIQTGCTLSLTIGATLTGLVWLSAPFIGEFFQEPTATHILQTLSAIFVINGIGSVPAHLLRRDLRFGALMIVDVSAYCVGYGLTAVVLAYQGHGVWSLVWGELSYRVIHTVMALCYTRNRLYPRWSGREATELMSTGAGFSLAGIFEFIARQGSHFIIGRWLGAAALGYYTRADRLILAPKNYVGQNLLRVLFPAMAQRQHGTERLTTVYRHGLEILSLLALPLSVMLFLAAPEIVLVILGEQWEPVIVLLRMLALAMPFQLCDVLNRACISAVGAVYRLAWRQGLQAVLVVVGAWYASRWGLQQVVMVVVSAQIIAYLLLTQLSASLLKLGARRFMRCCLPALWVALCTAMALLLTTELTRALALPDFPALVIKVLVWLATLITAIYFAPPPARPASLSWVSADLPLEALGPPGRYLRTGLMWLARQRGAGAAIK